MRSWRVGALGIPQVVFLLYQKGRDSIAARCSVASPGRQEKCSRAVSELNRMVRRAPIGHQSRTVAQAAALHSPLPRPAAHSPWRPRRRPVTAAEFSDLLRTLAPPSQAQPLALARQGENAAARRLACEAST